MTAEQAFFIFEWYVLRGVFYAAMVFAAYAFIRTRRLSDLLALPTSIAGRFLLSDTDFAIWFELWPRTMIVEPWFYTSALFTAALTVFATILVRSLLVKRISVIPLALSLGFLAVAYLNHGSLYILIPQAATALGLLIIQVVLFWFVLRDCITLMSRLRDHQKVEPNQPVEPTSHSAPHRDSRLT